MPVGISAGRLKEEDRGNRGSHIWKRENFEHEKSCCRININDQCKGEEESICDTLNSRGDKKS